ncbi:hypothetical protein [Leptospira santarosai]|uniref:hypothetical protein n=1 Tax=Leptospira santarosai TaxID=28183 RepID=UPI00138F18DF|nr:hypothetical protein [Leptospira santarosai]
MKLLIFCILHGLVLQNCKPNHGDDSASLLALLFTSNVASACATPKITTSDLLLRFVPYSILTNQYVGGLAYVENLEFGRRINLKMTTSDPSKYAPLFYKASGPCDVPQSYSISSLNSYRFLFANGNKINSTMVSLTGNLMVMSASRNTSKVIPTDISVSLDSKAVCKTPIIATTTIKPLIFDFEGATSIAIVKIDNYVPNQLISLTSTTSSLTNFSPMAVQGSDPCFPTSFKDISLGSNNVSANQISWFSDTASGPITVLFQYPDSTTSAPTDIQIQLQ